MVENLQSMLGCLDPLPCQGRYFHVRCSTHILNLIVRDGSKVINGSVELVRENVKYIYAS